MESLCIRHLMPWLFSELTVQHSDNGKGFRDHFHLTSWLENLEELKLCMPAPFTAIATMMGKSIHAGVIHQDNPTEVQRR